MTSPRAPHPSRPAATAPGSAAAGGSALAPGVAAGGLIPAHAGGAAAARGLPAARGGVGPGSGLGRRELLRGGAALFGAGFGGSLLLGCEGKSGAARAERAAQELAAAQREAARAGDLAGVRLEFAARPAIDGAGATVRRLFPHPQLQHLDPFVLLDDFRVSEPAGFPMHPHRGFEAFTYMTAGAFAHEDTLGNASVIDAGGTQRFASGRGAYHSEMPAAPGSNDGLQLWVNLPRARKAMTPEYQGEGAGGQPRTRDGAVDVRQVAGRGAASQLHTPVDYVDATWVAPGSWWRTLEGGWNAVVYVLRGPVQLQGRELAEGRVAVLTAGRAELVGGAGARVAWIAGKPHGEPIRHRGPFVD